MLILVMLSGISSIARAGLDQAYSPNGGAGQGSFGSAIATGATRAQTFTVGTSGLLTEVDVALWRFNGTAGDLTVDIRSTSGGVPNATLVTRTVPYSSIAAQQPGVLTPPWLPIDFSSAPLPVNSGDALAIVLHVDSGNAAYNWFGDTITSVGHDPYAGGAALSFNGTWGPAIPATSGDFGFKTFVTVPEPGTVVWMGGTLVLLNRRRRHC